MTERPGWHSEHTLMLAIFVVVAAVFASAILMGAAVMKGGLVEDMVPYAAVLLVGGGLAAWLINTYGKQRARRQRPEWLETQAWHREFEDKLKQADLRDDQKSGPKPGEPGPKP